MGTCCVAHLATMIRNYAPNAQNRAVTVTIIENPSFVIVKPFEGSTIKYKTERRNGTFQKVQEVRHFVKCAYCQAPAAFKVSYPHKT